MSLRRKTAGMEAIGKYFSRRLNTVFAGVAPNPYTLLNNKGCPLFLLCFAVGNPNAVNTAPRIAQHVLDAERAEPAMLPLG